MLRRLLFRSQPDDRGNLPCEGPATGADAPCRRLHLALAASVAALIFGVRLWQLHDLYPGSNLLFDDWFALYEWVVPFAKDGHFPLASYVAPYREHHLFSTHLTYMLCYFFTGRWEPLVLAVVVALVFGILGFVLTAILTRQAPNTLHRLITIVPIIIINTLPLGYVYTLWSGTLLYWYLILYAFLALWGLLLYAPFSWRWLLGLAASVMAALEVGSGGLVALTVFGVQGLGIVHAWRNGRRLRGGWITLASAALVFCLSLWLQTTVMRAKALPNVHAVLSMFVRLLAWPFGISSSGYSENVPWGWAFVVQIPYIVFAVIFLFRTLRRRREISPDERYLFALGLFLWVTLGAMAYVRSKGAPPERYFQMLAFMPFVSFLSWRLVWRAMASDLSCLRFALSPVLACWVGVVAYGFISMCYVVRDPQTRLAAWPPNVQVLAQGITASLAQTRMYQVTSRPEVLEEKFQGMPFWIKYAGDSLVCASVKRLIPSDAIVPPFPAAADRYTSGFEMNDIPAQDACRFRHEDTMSSFSAPARACFVSKPFLMESTLVEVPLLTMDAQKAGDETRTYEKISAGIVSEPLSAQDFPVYVFDLPKTKITKLRFDPVACAADVVIKSFEIRQGNRLLLSVDVGDPSRMALSDAVERLPTFKDVCALRYHTEKLFEGHTSAVEFPVSPALDLGSQDGVCCAVRMWSSAASTAQLYWDSGTGWTEENSQKRDVGASPEGDLVARIVAQGDVTDRNWVDLQQDCSSKREWGPWTSYRVPVAAEVCRLVVVDDNPDAWVAFAAPRDYAKLLLAVERIIALNQLIVAVGVTLLVLCLSWPMLRRRRAVGATASSTEGNHHRLAA